MKKIVGLLLGSCLIGSAQSFAPITPLDPGKNWGVSDIEGHGFYNDIIKSDGTRVGHFNGHAKVQKIEAPSREYGDPFLALITLESWFTPGRMMGDGYDMRWNNAEVVIDIGLRPTNSTTAVYKDVGPTNDPFISKIVTSSYTSGIEYGFTSSEGFVLKGGTTATYSETYEKTSPTMDQRMSSPDNLYSLWKFVFSGTDQSSKSTFHITLSMLYEVKPYGEWAFFDAQFDIDYRLNGLWFFETSNTWSNPGTDWYNPAFAVEVN